FPRRSSDFQAAGQLLLGLFLLFRELLEALRVRFRVREWHDHETRQALAGATELEGQFAGFAIRASEGIKMAALEDASEECFLLPDGFVVFCPWRKMAGHGQEPGAHGR